jgi:hypothetical protein
MNPLLTLLAIPTVKVWLVTKTPSDVSEIPLGLATGDRTVIEEQDGLYDVHDLEPAATITIMRRLNLGQLSGTHVLPDSLGFVHWHLKITGDSA